LADVLSGSSTSGPEGKKVLTINKLPYAIANKGEIGFTLDFDSGVSMNPGMSLAQRRRKSTIHTSQDDAMTRWSTFWLSHCAP
jgi:hypothetical protein